mmetsp:Transcript_177883/g.570593  ORF Transcript_177883/g.570593 Transcript_177883/m.570593 type:complete len:336 (+) Transcript_177883:139-1146(+)
MAEILILKLRKPSSQHRVLDTAHIFTTNSGQAPAPPLRALAVVVVAPAMGNTTRIQSDRVEVSCSHGRELPRRRLRALALYVATPSHNSEIRSESHGVVCSSGHLHDLLRWFERRNPAALSIRVIAPTKESSVAARGHGVVAAALHMYELVTGLQGRNPGALSEDVLSPSHDPSGAGDGCGVVASSGHLDELLRLVWHLALSAPVVAPAIQFAVGGEGRRVVFPRSQLRHFLGRRKRRCLGAFTIGVIAPTDQAARRSQCRHMRETDGQHLTRCICRHLPRSFSRQVSPKLRKTFVLRDGGCAVTSSKYGREDILWPLRGEAPRREVVDSDLSVA